MNKKIFFFFILGIILFILNFIIFFLFTRICLSLYIKISFSDIFWEPGAILHLRERKETFFNHEESFKNTIKKFIYTYSYLLIPELKNLPQKINHPIIQICDINNPRAYSKKITEKVEIRPVTLFTPYIMYAPMPGVYYKAYHNIQQFRYKEDLKKKSKDEIRIFITGGSTCWGCKAPDDDSTISAFLEKILKGQFNSYEVKVINAGMDGFDTTGERIWIFNRITEFEPDIIISFSGFNDIRYTYLIGRDLFNNLHNDGSYYFWAIEEYERFNRGEKIAQKIREYDYSKIFFNKEDFPRKTIKNIQIISLYLSYIGVKYVFVLQPFNKNIAPEKSIILGHQLAKILKKESKKLNFIFFNYIDLFKDKEYLFVDDCHFGDIGYKIIAENLARDIKPIILEIIKEREKNV